MHALAQPFVVSLALDVDTKTGGHCRQGTVGTGERGRHDAYGEQHGQGSACTLDVHRQQVVALFRKFQPLLTEQDNEQHTQRHEQQIGRHEGKPVGAHVLLGFA